MVPVAWRVWLAWYQAFSRAASVGMSPGSSLVGVRTDVAPQARLSYVGLGAYRGGQHLVVVGVSCFFDLVGHRESGVPRVEVGEPLG